MQVKEPPEIKLSIKAGLKDKIVSSRYRGFSVRRLPYLETFFGIFKMEGSVDGHRYFKKGFPCKPSILLDLVDMETQP